MLGWSIFSAATSIGTVLWSNPMSLNAKWSQLCSYVSRRGGTGGGVRVRTSSVDFGGFNSGTFYADRSETGDGFESSFTYWSHSSGIPSGRSDVQTDLTHGIHDFRLMIFFGNRCIGCVCLNRFDFEVDFGYGIIAVIIVTCVTRARQSGQGGRWWEQDGTLITQRIVDSGGNRWVRLCVRFRCRLVKGMNDIENKSADLLNDYWHFSPWHPLTIFVVNQWYRTRLCLTHHRSHEWTFVSSLNWIHPVDVESKISC